MSESEVKQALTLARKALESDLEGLGPLMLALRVMREVRPAWFTAPLYAEILEPFSDLCLESFGEAPQKLFQTAVRLGDARGTEISIPDFPQSLLEKLYIDLNDIKSPADLRDKVFVHFDEKYSYCLGYNAADALYRVLVSVLTKRYPTFGTHKGKSLEEFVRRRLEKLGPSWSLRSSVILKEHEKDILAWDDDSALAVECKSLRIRGSATDWSILNLDRDVREVHAAMEQLSPAMDFLKHGGRLQEDLQVPPHENVQGMIVTDDPFTSYVRAGLDRLDMGDNGPDWHGRRIWVGSFLDLDYMVKVTGTMGVFLHYLQNYRHEAAIRMVDEPEALSGYGNATTHVLRQAGALLVVREHDWDKSRTNGVDSFAPTWLTRSNLVRKFDERRSSKKAMRIVEQDLALAMREERRKLEKHASPSLDSETIEKLKRTLSALEGERSRRPKHPYRSL